MKSFTELDAWKVGMQLIKEVHFLTKKFPQEERYGMTAQIRKSSASVLANIAEGFGRYTYPDKANRYIIARGECTETAAYLYIAAELEWISLCEMERAIDLARQTGKLLSGLIASCKKLS